MTLYERNTENKTVMIRIVNDFWNRQNTKTMTIPSREKYQWFDRAAQYSSNCGPSVYDQFPPDDKVYSKQEGPPSNGSCEIQQYQNLVRYDSF